MVPKTVYILWKKTDSVNTTVQCMGLYYQLDNQVLLGADNKLPLAITDKNIQYYGGQR